MRDHNKNKRARQHGPRSGGGKATSLVRRRKALYAQYRGYNLRFIIDLFTALGVSAQDFGHLTGETNNYATQLRTALLKDDMMLSKARRLLAYVGYGVKVSLRDKQENVQAGEDPSYVVSLPEDLHIDKIPYEDSNLFFLRKFMSDNHISQVNLAASLGVTPTAVRSWFAVDDIRISYLMAIKDLYGGILEFTIVPLSDD